MTQEEQRRILIPIMYLTIWVCIGGLALLDQWVSAVGFALLAILFTPSIVHMWRRLKKKEK